jgi:AmmeMemoRadiSam system protein B
LPILVGSPYEFILNGKLPENEKINNILKTLKYVVEQSNKRVMFIASVDFAHVGRKFGDEFDAETVLEQLEIEDKLLIHSIEDGNKITFFEKIIADKDKWKICGVSSIYALMQLINPKKGKLIDYAIWNETPTKSAVSFASIALFK